MLTAKCDESLCLSVADQCVMCQRERKGLCHTLTFSNFLIIKPNSTGPQILQQLHGQLNPIPEDVLSMAAELMARRIDMLNLLRGKYRSDRSSYVTVSIRYQIITSTSAMFLVCITFFVLQNMEWKTKNNEFDAETEKLHRMVAGTAENLKAKLNFSMELAK